MIVSLTPDETWMEAHLAREAWVPPAAPLLVVAPHPDDETLGAGALIATVRSRGIPVSVVAATDGENAYDTPPEDREKLGRLRDAEQTRALAKLGVPGQAIHRLHLTDSGLHLQEAELTEKLTAIATPGTHLLAPWIGDFHPDHEACARAAQTVARAKGLQLTWYFFWTWHRGTPELLAHLPLRKFIPDVAALQAKTAALACHTSQLEREGEEPILPARLLGPARWPFEVFLPA